MKRFAAVMLALSAAACQSSKQGTDLSGEIYPPPAPAAMQSGASDERLTQLQTSMTELLERIDVLNDRMSRLESNAAASAASAPQPQAMPQPMPQPRAGEQQLSPVPMAQPMPMPVPVAQTAAPMPAGNSAPLVGARIADNYRGALELYGKNKFADARKAFQQVLDSDAAGELADNALYWIGETYFAQNNYAEAMKYYQRVTKEYPDQNKAPDALYKIGVTQEKSGDLGLARKTFEECIQRYAYSSAAASARLELKRIKY